MPEQRSSNLRPRLTSANLTKRRWGRRKSSEANKTRDESYPYAVVVPHDWDFAGSFVLGNQRDTGVCPVAYLFDSPAVLYNRLMRLLIFTGVPKNECRFSDCS